jgi:hypothetical protein
VLVSSIMIAETFSNSWSELLTSSLVVKAEGPILSRHPKVVRVNVSNPAQNHQL